MRDYNTSDFLRAIAVNIREPHEQWAALSRAHNWAAEKAERTPGTQKANWDCLAQRLRGAMMAHAYFVE